MSLKIALERIEEAHDSNADALDLSRLGLVEIPTEISKAISLTTLDLSGNELGEIKGLATLTNLTSLDLAYNELGEIKGLAALVNLTTLDLSGNELGEIKGLATLTNLTTLYLYSNQLNEIKGLDHLTNLTRLNLSSNQLIEIKGLDHLTNLTGLDVYSNKLGEIKGLDHLTNLTTLHLFHNQLNEIKGLDHLTNLTGLYLSGNQLIKIKGLDHLTNLTKLYLANNKIGEIKDLDHLTNLTELDLYSNQLIKIKGLDHLINLTRLDLSFNQLKELPEYLLDFKLPILWKTSGNEDGIYLAENPFTNPPPEVIQQGNKAIREYFKEKEKGEELLLEAKLILLGDGRSGKTSLANRLLEKPLPKEKDRTQGVDIVIGEYSFPIANGKQFKLNIWDFAGQDKYKTLHQLFYTESSLYVMVAESGNMGTDFDDWLQAAELFGEGSPLIVVLNEFKAGIGMGSFDQSYWKKQFPELLKEAFTTNLLTKDKFDKVEEYIQLLVQTLPHTKYAFPSNWAAIRRVLNERREEQFITTKEYLKICEDNNLPERESALILSSVLHKIGDCLHYQKNKLLAQFIILKNEWATEAVYKILDDKIVAEDKCGFFDESDLERIWDSEEYRDMQPQLLELMQQFKMAYKLPGKHEYVTPPLLRTARPEMDFSWSDALELYIDYEFLPKALLTQFIVSRHVDIAKGRTLVWRNGVVLEWPKEARAEVSKTKLQGKDAFYIRSTGKNRKGMITVILNTFHELYEEYKGIKYEEKVPCTCEGCQTQKNKQHYFTFSNLKNRLEKGRFKVECDQSLDEVNVLELLENNFIFENIQQGKPLALKNEIARESKSEIRVLKIFLASSNELEAERARIEQAIGRKNKVLRKQGFFIELLIWEDSKFIGQSFRSQDNYNLAVAECDLFTLLFYSKVGKFSLEEFEKAKLRFDEEAIPRIVIFQKDIDLPKDQSKADANSRFDFLELLRKEEEEHFTIPFQNLDGLVNSFENAIGKLLREEAFVEVLEIE